MLRISTSRPCPFPHEMGQSYMKDWILVPKGQFTPWTMKLDHGRWPFSMVRLDGPTSMVQFLKKSIYKAFGPLTRCKPNVDQEEWPFTKSECADFFNIHPKREVMKKFKFDHSLVFIFTSPRNISLKIYYNIISLPWDLAFFYWSTSLASPTAKLVGPC